jgi:hypothetical protein
MNLVQHMIRVVHNNMILSPLSTEEVKNVLLPATINDIRDMMTNRGFDTPQLDVHVVYLSYLVAKGLINDVIAFIHLLGEDATEVINSTHELLYDGTVLHIALYYNTDYVGKALFSILRLHGAVYKLNYYEQYPWEQLGECLWIHPLTGKELGTRNEEEFVNVYNEIVAEYHLSDLSDM